MTAHVRHRTRAYAPDPRAPGRGCDMPECAAAGEYRAPKSRSNLEEYHWFCLEHVRAYNASWDFYKGMSPGEIEAHMRADTGWGRPTWPLGRLGAGHLEEESLADRLDILGAGGLRGAPAPAPARAERPPAELREPLSALGLGWPVSMAEVKMRYKELAKQHHPDANGGDRGAEERLKSINIAYAALRAHFAPERRTAAGTAAAAADRAA